jgi:SAM-dependent methyltransferase
MESGKSPTERFTDRVANYVKYRPSYPKEVVDTLVKYCLKDEITVIADIESGTGTLSSLLTDRGYRVFAVEPNNEMRLAAEERFKDNRLFRSLPGSAESTGLEDGSIDLVTAAQAFHWFDRKACRKEFLRILKKESMLAIIWNQRKTDSVFSKAYDELLKKFADEYKIVNHRNIDDDEVKAFFGNCCKLFTFENAQTFDFEGLKGRMLSSSYTPTPGNPEYEALIAELESLFAAHSKNDRVIFEYETRLFAGRLV